MLESLARLIKSLGGVVLVNDIASATYSTICVKSPTGKFLRTDINRSRRSVCSIVDVKSTVMRFSDKDSPLGLQMRQKLTNAAITRSKYS